LAGVLSGETRQEAKKLAIEGGFAGDRVRVKSEREKTGGERTSKAGVRSGERGRIVVRTTYYQSYGTREKGQRVKGFTEGRVQSGKRPET